MRKMMNMRDDGNFPLMELYKTESSVEPDAAYQQQQKDYLSSIHDLRVPYNGFELDHYAVDTNDYLSLVGLKIDGHDVVAAMPSMHAADDDIKLLLGDNDIDMRQYDVQFCVIELIDMLLQDPQQQPHSDF